ncbi:hypothetical protein C7451_10412 [Blastomonas natatoria]|uniref:Uncharacterized protein n=1 Tax=Blastomonas natatoria TaxID=34015 RepID=A0A2V3VLQ5_9SPHN|nr:DUF5670 family protein [Blastomonas natatoria]PXW77519.1 hypothetical protein C7451_10412 [Blastomonas natatoria]
MPYKVIAIPLLFWLAGLATSVMLGGWIHLLFIISLFLFVAELMADKTA